MAERPVMSLPEAQALAERLKSIPADRATMMRETQAILALGDEVARLAAELAGAREMLANLPTENGHQPRCRAATHPSLPCATYCSAIRAALARLGDTS